MFKRLKSILPISSIMLKNLLIDWSGTLADDILPVFKASNAVLRKFGNSEISLEEFRKEFCLPYMDFYKKYIPNIPKDKIDSIFRKAIKPELKKITLLDCSREFLEFAKQRRIRVFIFSSFHHDELVKQIEDFGLIDYIEKIYGGVVDKRQKIFDVLKENNLSREQTLFIGDMEHDIQAGKSAGIKTAGVLTGYQSRETLIREKPDYLCTDIKEIMVILKNESKNNDK